MLSFNEGKACDAIIRHLEARSNLLRSHVLLHDKHPDPEKRIELTFALGATIYALEHTGIEPFPNFMRLNVKSPRLIDPIRDGASARLPTDEFFELHIPFGALFGKSKSELRSLQNAIIDFVVSLSTSIPLRDYANYRRPYLESPITPPNVPFQITLYRFRPPRRIELPYNLIIKNILPSNYEELRIERIRKACNNKFPKLAAWKRSVGACTVLILEDNDIQLTNQANVTEAYIPLALDREDRPDETYLLMTISNMWYICPILIDGKSYFDLADDGQDMLEVDPSSLNAITLR